MFFSYNTCLLFVIVLVSLQTVHGLTAFGKTPPNNQNQPQPTPTARARDCNTQADCAGIQDTSCVQDPIDKKTKCLCGDNKAPQNGQCTAKVKGIGHACNADKDCIPGGVCMMNNGTGSGTGAPKMCACPEDTQETAHMCSGGTPVSLQALLIPALLAVIGLSKYGTDY